MQNSFAVVGVVGQAVEDREVELRVVDRSADELAEVARRHVGVPHPERVDLLHRLVVGEGELADVAFLLQVGLDVLGQVLVIFDNQNFHDRIKLQLNSEENW